MPLSSDDLTLRLEAAAHARRLLRRATLEWAALGQAVLARRRAVATPASDPPNLDATRHGRVVSAHGTDSGPTEAGTE